MLQPPPAVYHSGALSYTIPRDDVVHMWCELDLTFRSAANDEWTVCTTVGFSFDRLMQTHCKRFAARMEGEMVTAGPGLFRVQMGQDEARVPFVECVALADYRWIVWVPAREPDDLYEWTLWRIEDVGHTSRVNAGPGCA